MPKTLTRIVAVAVLAAAAVAVPGTPAQASFTDVPSTFWAKTAIDYVARDRDWMRDFGTTTFKPEAIETKRLFARAVVKAFDPAGVPDPTITFPDLPSTDPFYPYANVAVKNGWITRWASGHFKPFNAMTTNMVHRALVLALGLQKEVDGLANIHRYDGAPIAVNKSRFPYMVLGMNLGFRVNHGNESEEVLPTTPLHRDEAAYSLWKAATVQSWQLTALAPFATISLPNLTPEKQKAVEFGFKYVGYPYIWGGEWHTGTGSGYCCGSQPVGGFDCSGLMWWVLKSPGGGYDNTSIRGYWGWSLPERGSASMAAVGKRYSWGERRPGDLMFYDSVSNPGVVSHVNVNIGNGWALDSSSSRGGASVARISSGYFYDRFLWARRIM